MKHICVWILAVVATLLLAAVAYGQASAQKKSYTFHGKVESVDKNGKNISVNNEKIEGWMEAMSMVYPIDDPAILDKLKPGDLITATVYDGDYSLHDIKVVGKSGAKPESKK